MVKPVLGVYDVSSKASRRDAAAQLIKNFRASGFKLRFRAAGCSPTKLIFHANADICNFAQALANTYRVQGTVVKLSYQRSGGVWSFCLRLPFSATSVIHLDQYDAGVVSLTFEA